MPLTSAEFPQGDTYGVTVYHGSHRPDLVRLWTHMPAYEGSLGEGVYVDFDPEVAAFYGQYVYSLKLLLHENEIFYLEPELIDGLENHSILVGEHIPPFSFRMKGNLYTVGLSSGFEEEWAKYEEMGAEDLDLDDIGAEVESQGYKALYVEGIRWYASVNSELLVFNEDDLQMVGLVGKKSDYREGKTAMTTPKYIRYEGRIYRKAMRVEDVRDLADLTQEDIEKMPEEEALLYFAKLASDIIRIERYLKVRKQMFSTLKSTHGAQALERLMGKVAEAEDVVMMLTEQKGRVSHANVLKELRTTMPELTSLLDELAEKHTSDPADVVKKYKKEDEPKSWKKKEHVPLVPVKESAFRSVAQQVDEVAGMRTLKKIERVLDKIISLKKYIEVPQEKAASVRYAGFLYERVVQGGKPTVSDEVTAKELYLFTINSNLPEAHKLRQQLKKEVYDPLLVFAKSGNYNPVEAAKSFIRFMVSAAKVYNAAHGSPATTKYYEIFNAADRREAAKLLQALFEGSAEFLEATQ